MKRLAFSLIELLIGVALISLVFLGLVEVCFKSFEVLRYIEDVKGSQVRAERVLGLLRMPFDHCGYGMPKDAAGYKRAFGSMNIEPFNWDGPFSVAPYMSGSLVREKGECRIAFGISTGERVMEEVNTSADRFWVKMSKKPDLLVKHGAGQAPMSVKNWLLFGAMLPDPCPLSFETLSTGSGTSLEMKLGAAPPTRNEVFIMQNEEAFYLRAFKCMVKRHSQGELTFYINDYAGNQVQPRVEGIIDARFEYGAANRFVTVRLLVRGEHRYGEIKTPGAVKGWPDEYTAEIPDDARQYRLFTYTARFGLKNF